MNVHSASSGDPSFEKIRNCTAANRGVPPACLHFFYGSHHLCALGTFGARPLGHHPGGFQCLITREWHMCYSFPPLFFLLRQLSHKTRRIKISNYPSTDGQRRSLRIGFRPRTDPQDFLSRPRSSFTIRGRKKFPTPRVRRPRRTRIMETQSRTPSRKLQRKLKHVFYPGFNRP